MKKEAKGFSLITFHQKQSSITPLFCARRSASTEPILYHLETFWPFLVRCAANLHAPLQYFLFLTRPNVRPHAPQYFIGMGSAVSCMGGAAVVGSKAILPISASAAILKNLRLFALLLTHWHRRSPHRPSRHRVPPPPLATVVTSGSTWRSHCNR